MKNTKALDSKISTVNRIGMKMQFSKGIILKILKFCLWQSEKMFEVSVQDQVTQHG